MWTFYRGITPKGFRLVAAVCPLLLLGALACSRTTTATGLQCTDLTGTPWTPEVSGVSPTNHDSTVVLSKSVTQTTGPVVGLAQAVPAAKEISVSIDMTEDLGASGSLTLMAQASSFPSTLQGSAFAYLVSLNDGVNEYINLSRSGAAGDCAASGYYQCSGGICTANAGCVLNTPSAYTDRDHWEQRQGYSDTADNYPSVNIFPTCNWAGGTALSVSSPSCAFNSTFFPTTPPAAATPARLRYGGTYTAKYVLLSDTYTTLNGYTSGLTVTAVRKTSPRTTPGGGIDVNFILVGTENIKASRTAKGKQNLNTLAAAVANYFSQSNTNLKVGAFNGVEWPCSKYGDLYANVGVSELGTLLEYSSTLLPSTSATQALNVFLVSTIKDDTGGDSNLTILGVDGAIGGPVMNGTAVSGMVVSTFDMLDQYNANCSSSETTCPLTKQEDAFFELGETVAHEMGHYLGLNHLTEGKGTTHDLVLDTPICTATQSVGGSNYITVNSCLSSDTNLYMGSTTCATDCSGYIATYSSSAGTFCPAAVSCEFNYVMWWTTKNFHEASGASDGNLFSAHQGGIISYHPLVQ